MSTIVNQKGATDELQLTALGVNLGTNIALSLFTLGAFCWLRPRNGVIYARKYKSSPEEKRAPKLEEGYFSWMKPVWSCPDEVLVDKIGLDAVVFIRFVRMCRQVFLAMAVIGCGVLIPVNVIGTLRAQEGGIAPADKIRMLSISGIKDLRWIWAHVGAMWCFSLILMFAMYRGYVAFLKFRIQYFESEAYQENMASRTVMLAGLPNSLQSDDKLTAFMGGLGLKDQPVQALVGRKVDKLPELMDKHKEMVTSLEKVMAKYFADPNKLPEKRPTVSLGRFCGSKVDAIDYYSQQIEELTDQIEKTRAEISKSQPTNYGFVSYGTIQAAHRVAKELSNPIVLRQRSKMIDPPDLFLSPVPKDIIWFNASNPKQLRKSRRVIVNGLFVVGSFLFFIPMGFLTTIAKLDTIIGLIPSTQEFFKNNPFVTGIVQSLLPVLFMDILFMIIRRLIVYLAFFQGNITKSSTDRSTLAKFYLFFTLNNLIVFALSGTIIGFFAEIKLILVNFNFSSGTWEAIKEFVGHQDNIVALLSKNVIDTSVFWVNYISLRNFSALLDLSQLISLALYWAKSTVTPRESKAMDKPAVFDFPTFFSAQMFLLTVALLYSVVAPLVLFFAVVYFSLASLVYKYQLMYVFRTKVETGGRLFRVVYNRLIFALILFQVIMIGVLNLQEAHKHSLAILPLPILTILFKMYLSKQYDPKIDFYDYGSARNEAHLFKSNRDSGSKGNTLSTNFENPVFHSKMIAALVPEGAKKLLSSKVLNGGKDNLPAEKKVKGSHKAATSSKPYPKQGSMGYDRQYSQSGQESFEMGHIQKSSKSGQKFQVLGSDPHDYGHFDNNPSPRQQHQQKHEYQPPHTLGVDDPMDDYYDDQKQSLTKSASRYNDNYASPPTSKPAAKVYGAQDMTSYVAGRYGADRSTDPYSYNSENAPPSTVTTTTSATKPSYMELAKLHQTDNYKSTGKATQYEDNHGLHMPPLNFSKIQSSRQQSSRKQAEPVQEVQQPTMIEDPISEAPSSRSRNQSSSEYYNAMDDYQSPPLVPAKSSRMPRQQQPQHASPRRMMTEPALHSSASSPSLSFSSSTVQGGDYGNHCGLSHSGSGTDLSSSVPRQTRQPARSQTQYPAETHYSGNRSNYNNNYNNNSHQSRGNM